jgi:hypothetical protein
LTAKVQFDSKPPPGLERKFTGELPGLLFNAGGEHRLRRCPAQVFQFAGGQQFAYLAFKLWFTWQERAKGAVKSAGR